MPGHIPFTSQIHPEVDMQCYAEWTVHKDALNAFFFEKEKENAVNINVR